MRKLPQRLVLPDVVYQRVATRRSHDLDGPYGVPRPRMQLTCWAANPGAAYQLAGVARQRLDGHKGAMGAVTVRSVQCTGEFDVEDPEAGRSGVALEFLIQLYEEE